MSYVPTPTHIPHASPQSQELAHRIEHVIREYKQSHPGLSDSEVSLAVQMASSRTGTGGRQTRTIQALLLGLTLALVLGTLLLWMRASS
jgi:hypothetical protein